MSRSSRTSNTSRNTRNTDSNTVSDTDVTTTTRRDRPVAINRVTASPTGERRVSDSRKLRYFTFQFNRDEVTRGRGSNSVRITDRTSNSTFELSLAEARSLYNLLSEQFSG